MIAWCGTLARSGGQEHHVVVRGSLHRSPFIAGRCVLIAPAFADSVGDLEDQFTGKLLDHALWTSDASRKDLSSAKVFRDDEWSDKQHRRHISSVVCVWENICELINSVDDLHRHPRDVSGTVTELRQSWRRSLGVAPLMPRLHASRAVVHRYCGTHHASLDRTT